ncbi:MAG: triphosphoribosyl-dephospho-CoA synthase CitG [Sphaerochaetaceae bacterium]|nr:triphosphoribosyl-dephospho-CoA synthase CitG [Sphaerochaetaceae bacterium]
MKIEEKFREITLNMMLDCREKRAENQLKLLAGYGKPVISFTMNIAGPVKSSYMIKRGFCIGLERIEGALLAKKAKVLEKQVFYNLTGPEAFIAVDCDAVTLKKIVSEIEDRDKLGRLFDIDVIDTDGRKLAREKERLCLLCSNKAKECASRRIHTVEELQKKTREILKKNVREFDSDKVAGYAVKALLYEVAVTPKPGLVDRNNCGSHSDMNFYTFLGSSVSLFPYFKKAYIIGLESSNEKQCFRKLRKAGIEAEQTMFFETDGINTHKGAVFSLGLFCCACGFCAIGNEDIFSCISRMTEGLCRTDFAKLSREKCETAGEELFLRQGLRGIRGEAEDGCPTVKNTGFPGLEQLLAKGMGYDRAGILSLLSMMAEKTDTNMVSRGGAENAEKVRERISVLLRKGEPDYMTLKKLDEDFISENLSPGGIADLLSVCFFLYFLRNLQN